MWQACCTISALQQSCPVGTNGEALTDDLPNPDVTYTHADWITTCTALLSKSKSRGTKSHVSRDQTEEDQTNSSQLWASVFRAPFMVEVERLLQQSCHGVMLRAKSQLFSALAAEGLVVDPSSLSVTINSMTIAGKNKKGANLEEGDFADWLPSPRIFRRAEFVRSLLEVNLTQPPNKYTPSRECTVTLNLTLIPNPLIVGGNHGDVW